VNVDLEKARIHREEEFRRKLLGALEDARKQRAQLAKASPGDARSSRSAVALAQLHAAVQAIPCDHSALKTLRWQELALPGRFVQLAEVQAEFMSRYGFDAPGDGDPERFLRDLYTAIEAAMSPN
jgi:hypothetical protein